MWSPDDGYPRIPASWRSCQPRPSTSPAICPGHRSPTRPRGRSCGTTSAGCTSPSRCDDRLRPRFRRSPSRRACRRELASLSVGGRLTTAVAPWLVRKRLNRYDSDPAASRADISKRLRKAAELLGPTYIKLGQIISSGEGLFPDELVDEFKQCRDQVPAEPFDDGAARSSRRTSGAPLEDVFASFDAHAARRGVDRPGARRHACAPARRSSSRCSGPPVDRARAHGPAGDGLARARTSSGASRSPRWPTRRRWSSCSPRRSSRSSTSGSRRPTCSTSPRCSHDLGQRGYVVPRPHPTLVTRRVLVMERLDGFNFDDVAGMQRRRHRHRGRGPHRR